MTSIRRRILLPLVPAIALALLAAGLAVEHSVRSDLLGGLDRSLLVLVRTVGAAVEVELTGEVELELEVLPMAEFAGGGSFYRVTDDTSELLFHSVEAPATIPVVQSQVGPIYGYYPVAGVRYRVCTLAVEREPEDDEEDREEWQESHPDEPLPTLESRQFWISVGQPTAAMDAAVAALRGRLVLGLAALFVVLVALPTWIVTRALQPLGRLSDEADHVGPEDPTRRLGAAGVDREVRALVVALNRALDRLAEAYERQQRFTADAAHELRTPLTTMRTNCEVTLRRERSKGELRDALESVHRTVLRMSGLVHDLLALSRLQQEAVLSDTATVDLATVAREAAALHAAAADAAAVHLAVEASASVPVVGNTGLLTECVANLVENAVRHTPAGGRVTVTARGGGEGQVTVSDTGSGIDAAHSERIFERFYRADPGRSRDAGGAGLGLALVAEIARVHGGRVTLMSQPGQGSAFTLHLPSPPDAKKPSRVRDGAS